MRRSRLTRHHLKVLRNRLRNNNTQLILFLDEVRIRFLQLFDQIRMLLVQLHELPILDEQLLIPQLKELELLEVLFERLEFANHRSELVFLLKKLLLKRFLRLLEDLVAFLEFLSDLLLKLELLGELEIDLLALLVH